MAGTPEVLLRRLQSVLNAAAKFIFLARKSEQCPHYSVNFISSEYRSGSSSSYACTIVFIIGTELPCHPPSFQLLYTPSPPVCQHISSHRPVDSSLVTWRPHVPGGCIRSQELVTPYPFNPECSFSKPFQLLHWCLAD